MKLNPDFHLNSVSGESMLINMGGNSVDLSLVFSLSESAAWLWERIGTAEFTREEALSWILEEYDVSSGEAEADLGELLSQWKEYGMLSD